MTKNKPSSLTTVTPLDFHEYWQRDRRPEQTVFCKPKEIGAFSIDDKRKFHNDRRQLAYVVDPSSLPCNFDLGDGFKDRFVKRDEGVKERLNHILRWILCNLHRFKEETNEVTQNLGSLPDFVLWRGHMTKVMCTPYENQDGWLMAAQKEGSTIYISEVETAEAEERRLRRTEREAQMMFWGVRFEKYMTTPNPPGNTDSNDRDEPRRKVGRFQPVDQKKVIVNTNEAFCTVVRGKINSHSIIHGAEVDCCYPSKQGLTPPDNYVELKTSRVFSVRKQEDNFHKYKTKKWWAQSYLAGVPQIMCGFRDDDGYAVDIRTYNTLDFPRMARNVPGGGWDANVCLNFLNDFFSKVKKVFRDHGDDDVFLFSWNPGDRTISCEKHASPTPHSFLPEWYTTSLRYTQTKQVG